MMTTRGIRGAIDVAQDPEEEIRHVYPGTAAGFRPDLKIERALDLTC
jgi:chorismate mutase